MSLTALPSLPEMLQTKLLYDAARQKLLAQNVAALDAPGYIAKDLKKLDFHAMLSAGGNGVALAVTSPMHMTGRSAAASSYFRAEPERHPYERTPAGSTAVVEEQMMHMSQNAADYQLTANLYKKIGNLTKQALGQQPSS